MFFRFAQGTFSPPIKQTLAPATESPLYLSSRLIKERLIYIVYRLYGRIPDDFHFGVGVFRHYGIRYVSHSGPKCLF